MKKPKPNAKPFKVPPALLNALAPFRDEAKRNVFLIMLGMYARVDRDLAKLLHALAAGFTEQLCLAANSCPELFRPLAHPEGAWPVFAGNLQDGGKTLALLEKIELGRDFWLNVNKGKRQWSERTPEIRVALGLLAEMNSCRAGGFHRYDGDDEKQWENRVRKLPVFARATCKHWFSAAMPLFHHLYDDGDRNIGGNFEDADEFADYWRGDAYKESDPGNPGQRRLVRYARSLIRRDIKKRIQQAFRSLAPKSPPV